ncbi:hypothetical protein HYFRA_00011637 [Hymenoscyphus fraxineus]|uniref:tripeptidyl-peptidase II n=1 Tax=Hymenoscyphus fraxineus TaxID=746836 RepID=A0A9N9L062_9HELO|nr:hypothetical protein HYFRA_00011637 [Hymenoscyphus fraxineus]
MVSFKSLFVVLAISTLTFASPATQKCSVAEKLSGPPTGWEIDSGSRIDKEKGTIKLRIGLVQENMSKFHEMAMRIATPGDEMYGAHMAQHVIDKIIAPKSESKDLVMQWLEGEGLRDVATLSPRLDSVVVEGSIKQIEKLLKAEYSAFIHTESHDRVIRTLEYSLPDVLKGHVDVVQPTTVFGLKSMRSMIKDVKPYTEEEVDNIMADVDAQAVAGCTGSSITPACLANLYSFANAANESVGLMGIAGFLRQHPIQSDLTTFMNRYAYFANKAQKFTCALLNGGTCPTSDNTNNIVEANLDVQYARAITSNIPNIYYSAGGNGPFVGGGENTNEPWLEWLNYMLALPDSSLPNTISISYGDDTLSLPNNYMVAQCNLFSQLGARGVSVLVASGDSGIGSTCSHSGQRQFDTSFPAGCPWVTTVGGTTGTTTEGAWSYGGGGFSEVFARPSYQDSTVTSWLSRDTAHTTYSNYFNSSGRAYPDVSAQAVNYLVVLGGSASGVSGTSASCPTFASVIQLINSQRLASGKKGLGFLNPWLYSSAASAMNDITTGSIRGCSNIGSGAGFVARAGWDPATGLGSPNYTKLLAVSQSTA